MATNGRGKHDRYGFDQELRQRYAVTFLAGVDEVGRGPLAGPVVAAAVILPADVDVPGADDSKRLTPAQRVLVAIEVRRVALAIGFGCVSPAVIDRINILEATRLAMRRALAALSPAPHLIVVDGWPLPASPFRQEALPRADSLSLAVACASVVAKVRRDRLMARYGRVFPQYDFGGNKGYPTPGHKQALERHGPCLLHRQSFAPGSQLRLLLAAT
ncbi:MAG: ribonuclease HII [Candidatus Eisenbacteria bacterium]|nr:ribonuclease HII [Candidatus Eisenbacteria bacterium]